MTEPGLDPDVTHPHVFRARRAVASLVVVGLCALGAALLAQGGRPVREAASSPPQVQQEQVTSPLQTTPPRTRALQQARAVEHVRLRLPYVAVAGRQHREVALTFDDGPGPYTLRVLRELRQLHVPATFFQVGSQARTFSDADRLEVRDPAFVIDNHTWSHRKLSTLSPRDQADQLDAMSALMQQRGAGLPQLFRPPYGAFDRSTLRLLDARHMLTVLWTVDSEDYERPGTQRIVANVLAGVRPGAIVLMHDAGGDRSQTVAALRPLVEALRAKHYALVTVPRLLTDNPPPERQPPITVGVG